MLNNNLSSKLNCNSSQFLFFLVNSYISKLLIRKSIYYWTDCEDSSLFVCSKITHDFVSINKEQRYVIYVILWVMCVCGVISCERLSLIKYSKSFLLQNFLVDKILIMFFQLSFIQSFDHKSLFPSRILIICYETYIFGIVPDIYLIHAAGCGEVSFIKFLKGPNIL